jgi:hypothetical protein
MLRSNMSRKFRGTTAELFGKQFAADGPTSGHDRGCVKTKTDLAVKRFCEIQSSKFGRFETRLGFLAHFAQFAEVSRVFTQPRPESDVRQRQLYGAPESTARIGSLGSAKVAARIGEQNDKQRTKGTLARSSCWHAPRLSNGPHDRIVYCDEAGILRGTDPVNELRLQPTEAV